MGHIPTSLQQHHTASTTATASQQQQQGHVRADHHQHDSLLVLLLVLVCSGCGGVVLVGSAGFCDGNFQQFQLPQQKLSIVFSGSIETVLRTVLVMICSFGEKQIMIQSLLGRCVCLLMIHWAALHQVHIRRLNYQQFRGELLVLVLIN